MNSIETKNLSLAYGHNTIIDKLDLSIIKGKVTILIGANGCGKSTLLRSMARLMPPKEGSIFLDSADIHKMKTKDMAQKLAILPQSVSAPEGLTVLDLVKQGRYPHQNFLQRWTEDDEFCVMNAINDTGLIDCINKPVDSLSGGQRQRAWIAMILAQQTETILLDEPTTYLDVAYQIEVLDLLFLLNQRKQSTIVMVLHDLNLAARYADVLVALLHKKIFAHGRPSDVLTAENIHEIFGIKNSVISDPIFHTPLCIPHSHICKFGASLSNPVV